VRAEVVVALSESKESEKIVLLMRLGKTKTKNNHIAKRQVMPGGEVRKLKGGKTDDH